MFNHLLSTSIILQNGTWNMLTEGKYHNKNKCIMLKKGTATAEWSTTCTHHCLDMDTATHPTHISVLPLCICHVAFKVILGSGSQLLRYQCQEPVSDNRTLNGHHILGFNNFLLKIIQYATNTNLLTILFMLAGASVLLMGKESGDLSPVLRE